MLPEGWDHVSDKNKQILIYLIKLPILIYLIKMPILMAIHLLHIWPFAI